MQNESQETSQTTESEDQWPKTPTGQEEAKATSQEKGLLQRIEDCPSDRVKEVLLDSLNKENNTSDTNG